MTVYNLLGKSNPMIRSKAGSLKFQAIGIPKIEAT